MEPEWWAALAAIGALIVPAVGGVVSLSRTRIHARGEQAQNSLKLIEGLDDLTAKSTFTTLEKEALSATQRGLRDAARFAAAEYARLQLRDGWSVQTIFAVLAYGAFLAWAGAILLLALELDAPIGVFVLYLSVVIVGLVMVTVATVAWVLKVRRRGHMRNAGLKTPTAKESIAASLRWIGWARRRITQKNQLRRLAQSSD